MKRVLAIALFTVFTVSGCSCLDVDSFHSYACSFDGGGEQCPGDGVCGLEGTCHQRGDEKPWQCIDDGQCEGDWRCGPEKVCLDPQEEALLPASASNVTARAVGSLLPQGLPSFVSGAPESGLYLKIPGCDSFGEEDGGYSFTTRSGQITSLVLDGGFYKVVRWHGGRSALVDGGFPSIAQCSPDSGVPIVDRALDVAAVPLNVSPLATADVDLTTYMLTPGGVVCSYRLRDTLTVTPEGCAPMFASSPAPSRLRVTSRQYASSDVLVGLGTDHYQLHDLSAGTTSPIRRVHSMDGGSQRINDLIVYGYSRPVQLAATPRGIFARREDGLRIGDAGYALGANEWQPVAFGYDIPCEPELELGYHPAEPLRFSLTSSTSGRDLLSVHTRTAEYGGGGGFYDQVSNVLSATNDGGWYVPNSGCVFLPAPDAFEDQESAFVVDQRRCQLCPVNSRGKWFWARSERPFEGTALDGTDSVQDPVKLEGRCENFDGGPDLVALDPTGRCEGFADEKEFGVAPEDPVGARYTRPLRVDQSATGGLAVADDLGHLWQPDYRWPLIPWTLDRAPDFVYQGYTSLSAVRATENFRKLLDVPVPVLEMEAFDERPEGYLPTTEGTIPVVTVIDGKPRWVLVDIQGEGDVRVIGVFELGVPGSRPGEPVRAIARLPESGLFGAPFHSTVAHSSDGRTILIVTSFDTLLAADVTAVVNAPAPTTEFSFQEFFVSPEPAVKFTAVIHAPVQSLVALAAPLSPDLPEQYVNGYLVQGSRVFNFRASNLNVWRTEEVVLADETEPLSVFADGSRGRVGMKNGTVYSLPSRLTLADALPAAALPVTQFQQHCGQLFATAADGVYRLAVGADPKGTWERLALPQTLDFKGARVFGYESALRVFTADGAAYVVEGFECRAPAQ